jgi:hypothetical protein
MENAMAAGAYHDVLQNSIKSFAVPETDPRGVFMNPHSTPGSLFLTPRAPNGKRLPARARHHMRGSEDAPPPPGFFKRMGQAIAGGHLFGTLEGEKNKGEKPSSSVVAGWHMGGGEGSTGEDNKEQNNQFISAHHGQHVERSLKDAQLERGNDRSERRPTNAGNQNGTSDPANRVYQGSNGPFKLGKMIKVQKNGQTHYSIEHVPYQKP